MIRRVPYHPIHLELLTHVQTSLRIFSERDSNMPPNRFKGLGTQSLERTGIERVVLRDAGCSRMPLTKPERWPIFQHHLHTPTKRSKDQSSVTLGLMKINMYIYVCVKVHV